MALDMRTLDMRLLLNAIKKSEFKVASPEDYLRKAQTTNLTSTADEGELEDKLITFFIDYLDAEKSPNLIAKNFGTTKNAVVATREAWSTELAKYYS